MNFKLEEAAIADIDAASDSGTVTLRKLAEFYLETFVRSDRFRGTCYKAANCLHVGPTQGRGKLDARHLHARPIKDVWLHPLHHHSHHLLAQPVDPSPAATV